MPKKLTAYAIFKDPNFFDLLGVTCRLFKYGDEVRGGVKFESLTTIEGDLIRFTLHEDQIEEQQTQDPVEQVAVHPACLMCVLYLHE